MAILRERLQPIVLSPGTMNVCATFNLSSAVAVDVSQSGPKRWTCRHPHSHGRAANTVKKYLNVI